MKKGKTSVRKIEGAWGFNVFHISNCWDNLSLISLFTLNVHEHSSHTLFILTLSYFTMFIVWTYININILELNGFLVTCRGNGAAGGKGGEEGHGILEGISSLHSWIKSQTMIRPNKIVKKKVEEQYDDVSNFDLWYVKKRFLKIPIPFSYFLKPVK